MSTIDDELVYHRLLKLETAKVSLEAAAMRKGVVPSAVAELVEIDTWAERFLVAGKTPDEFIADLVKTRPHIMPEKLSTDEIARARVAFASLKGQGDYVKANGQAAAEKMALALGTKLGTISKTAEPVQRTDARATRDDATKSENPFKRDPPDPNEIAQLIKRIGTRAVAGLAAAAGKTIGGTDMRKS